MITIVSATNRKGSITYKVAMLYSKILDQVNVENQIFDLSSLPKDFIFTDFGNNQTDYFVNQVQQFINTADRFIIISPEYHGSYPGIFKAFIDCVGNHGFKEKIDPRRPQIGFPEKKRCFTKTDPEIQKS